MTTPVLCACPNLALERVQRVARLVPGEVLRSHANHVFAGGKGLNVARALGRLGTPATVVSFAGGRLGPVTVQLARDEGLDLVPVAVDGEMRSVAILVGDDGVVTMISDETAPIPSEAWARYAATVTARLDAATALVCSGSTPAGSPDDGYARLVRAARDRGVLSAVDATGARLRESLQAEPDLVSPNIAEARAALDGATVERVENGDDDEAAADCAVRLVDAGARAAMVSAGARGVAVVTSRGAAPQWVAAPRARVLSPIGAGDVLLGATVHALGTGLGLVDAVRRAVPVAAASVETLLPADVDLARAEALAASA